MASRPETVEIIERLTPEERKELLDSLLKRVRVKALADALVITDWLESTLKVANEYDLAEQARAMHEDLRVKRYE